MIQVLDQITIDKIAAGEVVERPASVIKELVENAIDAGASSITVEIEDGGISLMRITDNGCGIAKEDVPNAFLRHSTSKIRSIDDLEHIASLGFRGEALSSISAVAQVELITKTKDDTFGTRYVIHGGVEQSVEETGAPNGTTFLIHQLFYNTPARRKFLKTPMTEAGHIGDLLMHMALSHPEIAFQFVNNHQEKLRTSGNGKLKDVIYQIYGREVASNLLELDFDMRGVKMSGFLGKPIISRGNRNFENFFFNGRYIRSNIVSKAAEDAYKDFVMQHKFPFFVLHYSLPAEEMDVNVHPTKMEVRFHNQQDVYNTTYEAIHRCLLEPELISKIEAPDVPVTKPSAPQTVPEKKESIFSLKKPPAEAPATKDEDYFIEQMMQRVLREHQTYKVEHEVQMPALPASSPLPKDEFIYEKAEQLDLFEEKLLTREARMEYTLIGQLFDTYWLVQFKDSLYIIDQHAAHERVLYERTLKGMKDRTFTSQNISPPIVLNLSMTEENVLKDHLDRFTRIGFEIEPFGSGSYAVRAIPDNLFSIAKQELLLEMLDEMADGIGGNLTPDLIDEKVASMSCKAAVKGNNKLSAAEMDTLIGELLELENPYHCPHGRPTIIAMTKRELEKKFKRIV
ncbi:MAG: DNA mismatch repair endonuclease MutL [Hespellia sp.]|nr:DNA mismatch repair endonuclease MutL [Hespellia sp.]